MHHPGSKILKIRFHRSISHELAMRSPPQKKKQRLPPFSSVVLSRFLLLLLVAGIPQTRLVDVIVFRTPRFTTRGRCRWKMLKVVDLTWPTAVSGIYGNISKDIGANPAQTPKHTEWHSTSLNHIKSTNININHKIQISENQLNKKLPAILCVWALRALEDRPHAAGLSCIKLGPWRPWCLGKKNIEMLKGHHDKLKFDILWCDLFNQKNYEAKIFVKSQFISLETKMVDELLTRILRNG